MYHVVIRVTDQNTPISGATVRVDNTLEQTDADGTATFTVQNSHFEYAIVKDGYVHQLRNAELAGEVAAGGPQPFLLLVELTRASRWDEYYINDRASDIVYSPDWFHANLGRHRVNQSYESDNHRTNHKDDTASLHFSGSQIRVFVQGSPHGGLAAIRMDGGAAEVVDTWSPTSLDYMLVYEKYHLLPEQHQLEIRALGESAHTVNGEAWFSLDFFETSTLPVFAPFTPNDIQARFFNLYPQARVASWGQTGKGGLQEAGFVISPVGAPTILDRRFHADCDSEGLLTANLTGLQQDTSYHVRPYLVINGQVYYGHDSIKATLPQIELSTDTMGIFVGECSPIIMEQLHLANDSVDWSIAHEFGYKGDAKKVVNLSVNNDNSVSVTGVAEGEAVIKATSQLSPEICTKVMVTVARREKDTSIARTPPMGWSSWNAFGRVIDATKIRGIIDKMTSPITSDGKSLRDLGFDYIIVDGGWRENRLAPDGSVVANAHFGGQQGMKELADYAHSKGLKFGLHVLPGIRDCAGQYVGAKGNERKHLALYESWGVDFLKWDQCGGYGSKTPQNSNGVPFSTAVSVENMYKRIKYYMDNASRNIIFSISNYRFTDWAPSIGHMWRTTGDIRTSVNSEGATWENFTGIAAKNSESWAVAGPGGWNDPDFMVVGDPALNEVEMASSFNLWCIMAAPLILSVDLTDPEKSRLAVAIVSNQEVIAVNQDPLGKQGRPVLETSDSQIWAKPLADGSMAVLLMNLTNHPHDITVTWRDVVYDADHALAADAYRVRDLWAHADLGVMQDSYSVAGVPVHGTVMLRVQAAED